MAAWTSSELDQVEAAEELDLESLQRDGTLRRPVTMWVVRHGDDLYAGSVEKDALDALDAAYSAKYGRRYPSIVRSIVAPDARAATLKLVPR